MMENPFKFHGSESFPEHFIGRECEMQQLVSRTLEGPLTTIVGLSRMGKSSLVRHCFMERTQFDRWVKEEHMIPLYSSILSYANDPRGYFGSLAFQMRNSLNQWKRLCNIQNSEQISDIIDNFKEVIKIENISDRFTLICNSLTMLKDDFGMKFIFIVDELDSTLEPEWTKVHFNMLRTLTDHGPMVTCSRRTPEYIEEKKYGKGKVYFSGKSEILFVGVFSNDDVSLYWQHFNPYFMAAGFNEKDMEPYRKMVHNYAGNQPHLMNVMNSWAFDNNMLSRLKEASDTEDKAELERLFRIKVREAFDRDINKIEEQGLKDTAIKLISGNSIERPEDEKQIKLLIDYTFIKKVPSAEKRKMFGYDLGILTEGKYRYVSISEFTTHLFHEEFAQELSLKALKKEDLSLNEWLWRTELMLRDLVRISIREICHPEKRPFAITKDDGTEQGYEERWVEQYIRKHGNQTIKNGINKIRVNRYQRVTNSTRPKGELHFDLIDSATLGDIQYVFIQQQWKNFYGCVFDSKKCLSADHYIGNDKDYEAWCESTFADIKKVRDSEAHRNLGDHTDQVINSVKGKCKKVCEDIENWKKNRKKKGAQSK